MKGGIEVFPLDDPPGPVLFHDKMQDLLCILHSLLVQFEPVFLPGLLSGFHKSVQALGVWIFSFHLAL